MHTYPWKELEAAVCERNALVAERLQPGLKETRIRKMLGELSAKETVEPLLQLYAWKNGTRIDQKLALSKTGFFPRHPFQYIDLHRAILTKGYFKAVVAARPENRKFADAVNRYFSFMWNGSGRRMAIDLDSAKCRVMLIDQDAESPFRELYGTFEDFIADVIRANNENTALTCFQTE